jgi:hypothetical protein
LAIFAELAAQKNQRLEHLMPHHPVIGDFRVMISGSRRTPTYVVVRLPDRLRHGRLNQGRIAGYRIGKDQSGGNGNDFTTC